ncbi:lipopolysaccharide biosynthesis protein [Croceicoccus sp. F390]|uniref:Lipopolysaccharide biosynthesis protein n=1 Tax=Croceicoccus esteveae TaxID=3075597 RepID=A0ABU2ZGB5_9SPHN|nr:lipopolysaccharide biosynthesis protein [Croceicoccus sp. F390]MDT0575401.1 lipopolysaccharide biosynthesis protein [Croceicoccus sp. F390]
MARNSGWLLSGKGLGAVLSLFYIAIVTRTLGPAGYGVFALILTIALFIRRFITFDSWQGVVKFGHEYSETGDDIQLGRLLGATLSIDIMTSAAGLVLAPLICFGLGGFFGWEPVVQVWATFYTAVLLIGLYSTPTGLLRMLDRFGAGAAAETAVPIVRMIGALVALALAPGLDGFLIAWMVSELCVSIAYWALAWKYGRHIVGNIRLINPFSIGRRFPGLWRFLFASNINLTVTTLIAQAPILLLGSLADAAAAGYYRLAAQLSNSMTRISQLLSRAIFTEMARSNASADREFSRRELAHLLTRTSIAAGLAAAVIAIALLVFGKPLILLMSGAEYLPAFPLLLLLGMAAALEVGSVSIDPMLLATDRSRQLASVRLATLAIMLVGIAISFKDHGPLGIAWSVLVSTIVALVLRAILVLRTAAPDGRTKAAADQPDPDAYE